MAVEDIKLRKERVSLRTWLLTILVCSVGVLLLYLAGDERSWESYKALQSVIRSLGSLLFVTATINLLWQLWAKRAFLDEVLAKVGIAKEIEFAGILKITDSFHDAVDWKSLFRTVSKLDIFFAYGRTWRNTHVRELQELAAREGARIRVVLPDPDDEQTIVELARRFAYQPQQLRDLIKEAEEYFRNLHTFRGPKGAQIEIRFLPAAPVFSFYRFDHIAIIALYSHRRGRGPAVPTFVCEDGGTLYDYIRKEFDAMVTMGGLARLITDREEKSNE